MFGLENQKKKKAEPFTFELENQVKDSKQYRELKALIEKRISRIKEHLKSGEAKEEFDQIGVLLHGYTSLLKVLARCLTPSKK